MSEGAFDIKADNDTVDIITFECHVRSRHDKTTTMTTTSSRSPSSSSAPFVAVTFLADVVVGPLLWSTPSCLHPKTVAKNKFAACQAFEIFQFFSSFFFWLLTSALALVSLKTCYMALNA